jgi:molybdopterin-guanine dinucleotide biosynthesis protein A
MPSERSIDPADGAGWRAEGQVRVAVLAGGMAARMGAAKAAVELCGRPLISYPLAAAREAGLEPVVVAKRASELPALRERVIHEPDRPHHPLCGIVAALRERETAVVAVGCDMPFVSGALLRRIAGGAGGPGGALAARLDGRLQPLPARYTPADLPLLEDALAGERSLRSTLARLSPGVLDERELRDLGVPERLCFSVNDERDLLRARRWLEG